MPLWFSHPNFHPVLHHINWLLVTVGVFTQLITQKFFQTCICHEEMQDGPWGSIPGMDFALGAMIIFFRTIIEITGSLTENQSNISPDSSGSWWVDDPSPISQAWRYSWATAPCHLTDCCSHPSRQFIKSYGVTFLLHEVIWRYQSLFIPHSTSLICGINNLQNKLQQNYCNINCKINLQQNFIFIFLRKNKTTQEFIKENSFLVFMQLDMPSICKSRSIRNWLVFLCCLSLFPHPQEAHKDIRITKIRETLDWMFVSTIFM